MKRLKSIANFINENDVVADIGCDHGYLLKLAIEDKKIKKGYAIDNKEAPLNSAKNNLKNYHNIIYIQSDGLIQVNENDINCVVIAGMGGMLINKIFDDSKEKFININKIIVCPNRNMDKVRLNFNNNGFKITSEDIIFEDGKYYEIIVFEKGYQLLSENELYFGPYLLKNKSKIFINKWTEYYNKIKNIENKIDEINLIKGVIYES